MPTSPAVVVIEDQTELGNAIRDFLTSKGYHVTAVRDQLAAVATLRQKPADLVIADLPDGLDGSPDPLVAIARDFREIPRIVIRSPGDELPFFSPWRIEKHGATMRRPFRLDDLLSVARELVG